MVTLRFLLLAVLVEPRDVAVLPQIDLDLAKGQDVLGQAMLDQRVMEGVGEGLDTELEGPELGRGLEPLHLFGHEGLMAIFPWR